MLTRIAGNCYWMARYLERAENNADLLAMAEGHALLPEAAGGEGLWSTALEVGGTLDDYRQRIGAVTRDAVVRFMVLDRGNHSGIVACLRAARDNARSARHLLAESAWEAVNQSWIEADELDDAALNERGVAGITAWTAQRCGLVRGAWSDLWRDTLPHVLDLGQAVERADFIARILAEMLPGLLAGGTAPPTPGTALHRRWRSLLDGLGLEESYRRVHPRLEPVPVLRLALQHQTAPHGLLVNARRMAAAVIGFTGREEGQALAAARRLEGSVLAADLDEIVPEGIAAFIASLTVQTNRIGELVGRDHFN